MKKKKLNGTKADVNGMFSFAQMRGAFYAGKARGAEEFGSTAGHLGFALDSPDWTEWAKENLR